MIKRYLFTTSVCPKCPIAKEHLDSKNISYELMVVDKDPKAREAAINMRLSAAPTLLEVEVDSNGDGKEVARYSTIDEILNLG